MRRVLPLSLCGIALATSPAAGQTSLAGRAETNAADDATFALSRRVDPEGLTLLQPDRRRSPTGLLYPYPYAPPEGVAIGEPGRSWRLRGLAELGWVESWGGSDEAYFEEYGDYRDGVIDAARLELRNAESGAYAELGAHAVGRDDVSLFLDAGRRGSLRLRGFYDELPHRYANDARVLFDGLGTELLTLPQGLVPGASSEAEIDAALATRPEQRLSLTRERAGVDLQLAVNPVLGLRAGYRWEERSGERPFGGAISFAFPSPDVGSVVETVEPLDSVTHDFHGGLSVTDERVQIDLGYEGSVFDSRVESLTWENPFSGTGVERGRFALTPDNVQHRVHGTVSFSLPARGRWTHTASWISGRQNEHLLAPTVNDAFPDWRGPATSLARRKADARVDTTVLTSTLRLSPLRRLDVGARLRYRRRDDRTDYFALNPSLDDYGYVIEDGSFGVKDRFGAAPFDRERLSLEGSATLRVASRTRLSLEYEHERVTREERARARTREDRGRVSLSTRRIPRTTLRIAYEVSERGGSSFRRGRDALFYSVGPPDFALPPFGTPQRSLTSFEQHDLADRLAHDANVRLVLQLGDAADLALAGGARDEDYDLRHGLRRARAADAHVELTLRPSPGLDAYAFGGAEWRERELDTIDSATFLGDDLSPGGPVFPLDHAWTLRSRARSLTAGAGLSVRPLPALGLRADYQLLASRERLSYDFAGVGALAPGVGVAEAGSSFPDLRNVDHVLDASARIDLGEHVAARVLYRFQHSTIRNFHQSGLTPRIGHALYLAHVDGDFDAHVLGGAVQVRF